MADVPIHGTCTPAFEPVRTALASLVESGQDIGCSAAVVRNGELVADVWAGWTDESRTTEWGEHTITNVFSSTKTVCNLAALLLADRGELDVHAPVAHYWPEFKANGKDTVLVRHLLSHTAGLAAFRHPMRDDDIFDWDLCTSRLAEQELWWEPGTACGYHALTQGYLVGEVVRRITGQSLGAFVAQELAGPVGADFHIGTGPECDDRVVALIPPDNPDELHLATPPGSEEGSVGWAMSNNPRLPATVSATIPWRRAEIPAGNGHGNARSLALIQSIVSGEGETHGRRVMSAEGCARIFDEQWNGPELMMGVDLRLGIGYGISGPNLPLPGERICFWGGWGGSIVINDLDQHMTVAYVMNKMAGGTLGDMRGATVIGAAYMAALAG